MSLLFIECGTTLASPFNTGIQRVVRNIVRESQKVGHELGHQCIHVRFVESDFHVVETTIKIKPDSPVNPGIHLVARCANFIDKVLKRLLANRPYQMIRRIATPFVRYLHRKYLQGRFGPTINEVLTKQTDIAPGPVPSSPPVLLLLDSTWDLKMFSTVDKFRADGGLVCAVLYDLIPFTHPQTVLAHTRNAHTFWWKQAPLHLDSVMCISQTVRAEFLQWQDMQQLAHQLTPDQVGYFYLGSELSMDGDDAQLPNILLKNEPFFLLVGSIEPRKNYQLVLDAFEHLWREGKTPNLVIVGGHGWKSEALLNRIQTHPLNKKHLFLLKNTTDAELALLYRKTAALIIASVAEGFGLPIVEAFQHGAKVICSDIPVFREIATDRAVFFDVSNSRELADRVSENLCLISSQFNVHTTLGSEWLTWRESTTQLFSRLFSCVRPHR